LLQSVELPANRAEYLARGRSRPVHPFVDHLLHFQPSRLAAIHAAVEAAVIFILECGSHAFAFNNELVAAPVDRGSSPVTRLFYASDMF
jgi:hypothetical protein